MSKINFALDASLVDLVSLAVGNYSRSSMVQLEKMVADSLQVYPVEAYAPGIDSETSAVLTEPIGINLVTWNMDLTKTLYQKGSNVIIQQDEVKAPDSSYLSERVAWLPFTGNNEAQILRRTLTLDPNKVYKLSAILKLESGRFNASDVVRVTGGIAAAASVSLSVLNPYLKRYRLIEFTFQTAGREPKMPNNAHQAGDYAVTAVTSNTVTVTINYPVAANDLLGGQVLFSTVAGTYYLITANTANGTGGSVTLSLDATNLGGQGVSTSSRAILAAAPRQSVSIEFFSQSSAVINWGGLQVEQSSFRTSMIYQEAEVLVRSATYLNYRNSPIANLKTFGIFIEIKYWRGDGNLFEAGNFKGWIMGGRLYVQAGATTLAAPDELPTENVKIFIQVSEGSTSLSIYVNKILKARTALTNFTADLTASLVFTSTGVRCIQRFFTTDSLLLDGNPNVGNFALDEVADLFTNPVIIDATAISAHAPLLNLNPVTVPAKEPPVARSRILTVNYNTREITVDPNTGFVAGVEAQPISIWRGDYLVTRARMTVAPSGVTITLDTVAGVLIGDVVMAGNVDVPGRASARFPWDPIDQQIITAIDPALRRLKVASSLSFTKSRSFIISALYEDKAEVLIEDIDNTNGYLFVNNVSSIVVGDTIAQPQNETIVDPQNYFAGILNPVDGVTVQFKYSNGVVIENTNPFPVVVRPYIRIYL